MDVQVMQSAWSSLSPSYLNSYSLLNTLQNNCQKSVDYKIIQGSNLLNNINSNINPLILDSYEKQVQLPDFNDNLKIYSPEIIDYNSRLKVLQNASYEAPANISAQTFFEMSTKLNMISEGFLPEEVSSDKDQFFSLLNTYALLSTNVTEQEINNLMQKNIPIVQNLIMYNYNPQTGVVAYKPNDFSSIDEKV